MLAEGVPRQLLVRHKHAQQLLDCSPSFYWSLVRKGKITVVGNGRAGRADYASVTAYVAAETAARKAA
jgi:hypothetical protein